jgi:hypothetical protein
MKKIYSTKTSKIFSPILGIVNNTFKPRLIQKFSRMNVYNALAVPVHLYGNEIWALRRKNKKR